MEIPTYDELIDPVLRELAENPEGALFSAVRDAIARKLGITEQQRKELLPSGRYPVFANRVGWAHDRLKRAGLSRSLRRGVWCLTEKGTEFVRRNPGPLSEQQIKEIAEVKPGSTASGGAAGSGNENGDHQRTSEESAPSLHRSPKERIDAAVAELRESLAAEVLEATLRCSPSFFEHLVLDLLLAMGYGASRHDLQQTGRTGDGGIDGVITLDKLGLEKVYIQAKRYGEGSVGSSAIRDFYGALAERKASRGVFITSSSFTKSALDSAQRLSDSIVLVDGAKLARLMIEHDVGCSVEETIRISRLDSDYFDEVE